MNFQNVEVEVIQTVSISDKIVSNYDLPLKRLMLYSTLFRESNFQLKFELGLKFFCLSKAHFLLEKAFKLLSLKTIYISFKYHVL